MLPISRFFDFVNEHQLLPEGSRTLLAVSGGKDSVLMAKLFNAAGLRFGIAHCNFGLRGNESEGDEAFVQELANNFDVPFFSVRFDTANIATKRKISVQMAARDLRYQWLEQVRVENKYDSIAVAHHGSDVTETMLLNLVRGTGIAGLHGILPRREKLIRPLLFLSREEVASIVSDENILFREDSSNASAKYARNKLRLEVIPKLKELNAGLDLTFEKNSRRFLQVEEFLNTQVDALRATLFIPRKKDAYAIDLEQVKNLHPQQLLLFELFKPYHFSESVLEDLIRSLDSEPGKQFLSASHILLLDRDKLLLEPREELCFGEVFWHQSEDEISFDSTKFFKSVFGISMLKLEPDPNKVFFDESLLQYPLKLRLWKKGDYFYPFGMKGKKKLSDYLREMKIPLTQKKLVPLLLNGNGDVLWVMGFRSDNRYRITQETKKVITFEKTTN